MKKLVAVLLVLLVLASAGLVWMLVKIRAISMEAVPTGTGVTEQMTQLPTEQTVQETVFELSLEGITYSQDAAEICASSVSAEVLEKLPQMTALERVTVADGGSGENLDLLRQYCEEAGIAFCLELAGKTVTDEDTELVLPHVTQPQLRLLTLMPNLKRLHFPEPEAPAEMLLALREQLLDANITWEKTVLGVAFPQDTEQVDLTAVIARAEGESSDAKTAYEYGLENPVMGTQEEIPSSMKLDEKHPFPDKRDITQQLIAEVEGAMAYFPEAEQLTLCGAWLDNEAMAQLREAHREDYKVVWSIQCGPLATRTDAKLFMPTKYYVTAGSIADWHTAELKYCEEIVSMDIGHMSIAELDFVRYMPNLKYLDIALNHIVDLTPLAECKSLVFLVMHSLSLELDYSPLKECTALEDLNIADNPGDISPVFEMKQLKNLWITGCGQENYKRAKASLPDTNIGYHYGDPNAGWRRLPNYFKMRDELLMFYMK